MMARGMKLALLAAFLVVMAAEPGSAQQKPVNWDFLSIVGLTHPVGEYHKQFADEVRQRTNGQVNITVRPAGELPYKVSEALRVTGQGAVQLSDGYIGFLAGDTKIGVLTGLPFLVGTAEELKKAMVVLEPLVREDFARFGDDILYWYTWPPQNVYGRGKPILTLEDFKGRKIRTTSPEQSELMKRLGAVPVSLTGPEVPSAAQRGIMEAVITAGFNLLGWKWYEFCEWGYLPDVHIGGPSYIIVNKAALAALSPENQKILKEVGRRVPGEDAQGDPRPGAGRPADPGAAAPREDAHRLARGRAAGAQADRALLGRVGEAGRAQGGRGARPGQEDPRKVGGGKPADGRPWLPRAGGSRARSGASARRAWR